MQPDEMEIIADEEWEEHQRSQDPLEWLWAIRPKKTPRTFDEYWDLWPKGTVPSRDANAVIRRHLIKNRDTRPPVVNGVIGAITGRIDIAKIPSKYFQDLMIWQMPYFHTKSIDDLNAYYGWLWAGGPHALCGSPPCQAKTYPLYLICKDIVRERQRRRL
jgi:hypothetical protein